MEDETESVVFEKERKEDGDRCLKIFTALEAIEAEAQRRAQTILSRNDKNRASLGSNQSESRPSRLGTEEGQARERIYQEDIPIDIGGVSDV